MAKAKPLAITFFYLFLALFSALADIDLDRFHVSMRLASLGMGSAATLWWITDGQARGMPVPHMSLWNGLFWFAHLPVYYLSTRGWRGLLRLARHALYASLTVAAVLGSISAWANTHVSTVGQLDRTWAAFYAVSPTLMARVRTLGGEVHGYEPELSDEPRPDLRGFTFEPSGDPLAALDTLRPELGPGLVGFVAKLPSPFTGSPGRIAVVHAESPSEVMRALHTNGDNHGLSTDNVVARIERWDSEHGVTVLGIGFDWLTVQLTRVPADLPAFTREVYAFCPDVVDQEGISLDELEASIRATRVFTLWWD